MRYSNVFRANRCNLSALGGDGSKPAAAEPTPPSPEPRRGSHDRWVRAEAHATLTWVFALLVVSWPAVGGVLAAEAPGVAAYEVAPFEFLFPETDPGTLRRLSTLRVTLAREEFAPATFAVRSPRHFPQVTARIVAPRSPTQRLGSGCLELRVVKVWKQVRPGRTPAENKEFRVPELLLTDDTINPEERWEKNIYVGPRFPKELRTELYPNAMKQFWLTVHADAATEPGTYTGAIELLSAGKRFLRAPLEIRVLPYALPKPGKTYSIYFRVHVRPSAPNDFLYAPKARYMAELQSLREHGFNSLIIYEGTRPAIEEAYRRIRSVGIAGPVVFTGRSDEAHAAVVALARKFGREAWLYGIDEPGLRSEVRHLELSRRIHAAGGKVMTALRTDMCRRLDAKLPLDWTNLSHLYIPATHIEREYSGAAEKRALNVRHEIETYYWQCWGENPLWNRTNAGFYLWRSGLDGAAPYCTAAFHKCLPYHEDVRKFPPENPRRWLRVYATYYPTQGKPVPTLQYEALREGIDDVRYLRLATDLTAKLDGADPAEGKKLRAAQEALKKILAPFFYRAVPSAGHFAWAREGLVRLIAYLRGDVSELRLPKLRPTLTRAKLFTVGPPSGGKCDDAMIQEGSKTNHGLTNWISVGMLGENERRRALIRFELPPIPPSARVKRAELVLFPCGITWSKRPHRAVIAVHRVLLAWREDECTWYERARGKPWAAPGASALGKDIVAQPESLAEANNRYAKVTWDVTESVRTWYSDPGANHGLLLKLHVEDTARYQNAHIFPDSDTTAASNYRWWPRLRVELK